MKMLTSCAAVGTALCLTFSPTDASAADTGLYLGGGVGIYTLDIDEVDFDDNSQFLRGVVGFRFHPNLAVEGEYLKLFESSDDILGSNVDLDADGFSVSVRPIIPLTDAIDLYGRIGYTWYEFDISSDTLGGIEVTEDEKDFTWGGGVDFHLGDSLSLRGDFSRIEVEDSDLNLISAQILFRF